MSESYSLLAIDPGSESSAFLWCRVTPPDEWALPYGVVPLKVSIVDNDPPDAVRRYIHDGLTMLCSPPVALAFETLPGLFGGTSGADQLRADQFAHRLCGWCEVAEPGMFSSFWSVYRSTSRSMITGNSNGKDGDVRRALVDIYGGQRVAMGGGRCKTCKKKEGWLGRPRRDCPNCKGGHGATGFETPPGVFCDWVGSHGYAALAVAIVAAKRIGGTG